DGRGPSITRAVAQSVVKHVSALGTRAPVGREYTRTLIREFASGCDVHLVGSSHLAALAEAEFAGDPVTDVAIKQEITGCFVKNGSRRTDTIVLACTHYPLLLQRFRANAPSPVTLLDPASALA